ncbi:MAG: hypothetical protein U5N85_23400 [Arcicella sp.]|nr:hypothetical protein [Arcicella sp.]
MEKPVYPIYFAPDEYWYEFDSISEDKVIRKVVFCTLFDEMPDILPNTYQLVFGNLLPDNKIDTVDKSNNKDMKVILSTVIQTLLFFLELNPKPSVIFTGSTQSSTRLYRATISKIFNNLDDSYIVEGLTFDLGKEYFNPEKHYFAYLISKKHGN